MATISLRTQADVVIGGESKTMGSVTSAQNITVTEVRDNSVSIATEATWDAWTSADPVSDFDFLWIETDLTCWVEFTTDKDGDAAGTPGPDIYTVKLLADVPLVMVMDDSFAGYTVDFGGGAEDVIDQIRIKNPSASSAANVRFVIAT